MDFNKQVFEMIHGWYRFCNVIHDPFSNLFWRQEFFEY